MKFDARDVRAAFVHNRSYHEWTEFALQIERRRLERLIDENQAQQKALIGKLFDTTTMEGRAAWMKNQDAISILFSKHRALMAHYEKV